MKYSLAVLRGGWERERDRLLAQWKGETDSLRAALAALKSSEEEIAGLVREHRVRFSEVRLMEERVAALLQEPRRLAEEYKRELEKKLEGAFLELSALRDARIKDWEADLRGRLEAELGKLGGEIAAEKEKQGRSLASWTAGFNETLRNAISFGHASIEYEARKFKDALAGRLNVFSAQAGEAVKAESAELRKEFAVLAGKFAAVTDTLMRELRERAGAGLEKKLAEEMPSVYDGIRAALRKEAAEKIKEFADMADAELQAGRLAVSKDLEPRWEKLSAETAARFKETMREKIAETVEAEAAALRKELARETQKFSIARYSFVRDLSAAGTEASRTLEAESAGLREKLAAEAAALTRGLREKAGQELEKKLEEETPSVYAGMRAAFEKEAADKIKGFAEAAAAELEAGRLAVSEDLEPRWKSLSSEMTSRFEETLAEFKRRKEEGFSKALSEQAAELEFLGRETREKMESASSEFLGRVEEMKSWLEQTAGELAKAREALTAPGAARQYDAAGAAQAPGGPLDERLMELERKIAREALNRKEGALRSEIPVIIGAQKPGRDGKFRPPGAAPLYREEHSLRDNFTLVAALVAALLSVLSLLAR